MRHCITEGLIDVVPEGADVIQLRDKSAPVGVLLERAKKLRALYEGPIVVNDRLDVCLAAGLDGVHLPGNRVAPERLRRVAGKPLWIGVSCHNEEEVKWAEGEGADYVYLSPIFAVASKPGYGPALGIEYLARVCKAVRVPVLALGGVTVANEPQCLEAGAAGIAGISFFMI